MECVGFPDEVQLTEPGGGVRSLGGTTFMDP